MASRKALFNDCPVCHEGDMMYADFELYGSDADGNRGEPLTHFTCTVCGHEESMWGVGRSQTINMGAGQPAPGGDHV